MSCSLGSCESILGRFVPFFALYLDWPYRKETVTQSSPPHRLVTFLCLISIKIVSSHFSNITPYRVVGCPSGFLCSCDRASALFVSLYLASCSSSQYWESLMQNIPTDASSPPLLLIFLPPLLSVSQNRSLFSDSSLISSEILPWVPTVVYIRILLILLYWQSLQSLMRSFY